MQIDNIPHELKAYRQFILWRYEHRGEKKATKVPYDPRTGRMASVIEPTTWVSFEEAKAALELYPQHYNGVGFVLTKNDPFVFIDIDATADEAVKLAQQKIIAAFPSYMEISPSGTGIHIIGLGRVPSGRKKHHVEVYSSERYMTMTGNVFYASHLIDVQEEVNVLWDQLGGLTPGAVPLADQPETIGDQDLVNRAASAINGAKFMRLWNGQIVGEYPSQSEADLALMNIIAFYSQNRAQMRRLFKMSSLGQRPKANRIEYMEWLVEKALSALPPVVEFAGMDVLQAQAPLPPVTENTTPSNAPPLPKPAPPPLPVHKLYADNPLKGLWEPGPIARPEGLLGDMVDFIAAASARPVYEVALVAAIGMLAGIAGRSYNISGTGLNQYIMLVAQTGIGKESLAQGPTRLLTEIMKIVPGADLFVGPSEIASGQGLIRHLADKSPCFFSSVGEIGIKMAQWTNPRAMAADQTITRMLLQLYSKSGQHDVFGSSAYSDKSMNTKTIKAPCFTLIGETTPSTLYSALDESMISSGLLPRFTVIEYTGPRPPLSKMHHLVQPNPDFITRLCDVALHAMTVMQGNVVIDVQTDEEAAQLIDTLDTKIDAIINQNNKDAIRQLWNRAHLKVLKLAALVSIGRNSIEPIVMARDIKWALNVIAGDVMGMVGRFERGEVSSAQGADEAKQKRIVLNGCLDFLIEPADTLKTYGCGTDLQQHRVVPWTYLSRKFASSALFRQDKLGATAALKRAVNNLIDQGDLQEIGKAQMLATFKTGCRAFVIPAFTVREEELRS